MTTPFYKKSKKQITLQQLEAWTEDTRIKLLIKESAQMKKIRAKKKKAQRTLAEHEECYDLNTSSNASETDSEADIIEESKTKCKQPKLSVLNPSVCAVVNKHQVSHRALMEILSAHIISQGADLDDYAISTMASKRARDSVR